MSGISFGMVDLARRAHDSLELTKRGFRMGANVALFSAMSLEAFLNDMIYLTQNSDLAEGNVNLPMVAKLMEPLERTSSIEAKFELLYYLLAGKPLPKDRHLWGDFKFLVKIRNCIAHLRTSEISTTRTYDKAIADIVDQLRNRKLLNATRVTVGGLPDTWTMLLDESIPFAEWTIRTTQDMIVLIYREIPKSCIRRTIESLVSPNSTLMGGNRIIDGKLVSGRDIFKEHH